MSTRPLPELYPDFATRRITTSGAEIHVRHGGAGLPVILIHGYPQTHACWHRIAADLAREQTVVIPDLRGYGASSVPASDARHEVYSKRAMALDCVEVMRALGHERFAVVGHDRGGRVAYRLALDHPSSVTRLVTLDIVPTLSTWEDTSLKTSVGRFHWPFLAQPAPFPETVIGRDPIHFHEHLIASWTGAKNLSAISPEALDHYRASFTDPDRIHAMCEDYRAGASIDVELDAADRAAGRKITCPLLALWGQGRENAFFSGPLDTWRRWATDVRGRGLVSGHFLPEEAPRETLAEIVPFLRGMTAS
ncbi:MAG TPA: alpha/beta hydrolase [Hyphomicrobiaceae bacterium]|nr:alpha/beta hydrolase [Hyphomicrobiaceae bacterium]